MATGSHEIMVFSWKCIRICECRTNFWSHQRAHNRPRTNLTQWWILNPFSVNLWEYFPHIYNFLSKLTNFIPGPRSFTHRSFTYLVYGNNLGQTNVTDYRQPRLRRYYFGFTLEFRYVTRPMVVQLYLLTENLCAGRRMR